MAELRKSRSKNKKKTVTDQSTTSTTTTTTDPPTSTPTPQPQSTSKSSLQQAQDASAVKNIERTMTSNTKEGTSFDTTRDIEKRLIKKYKKLANVYRNEKWLSHFQKYMTGKCLHEKEQRKADARSQNLDFNEEEDALLNQVLPDVEEILLRICPKYKTEDVDVDQYVMLHRELRMEEEKIVQAKLLFQNLLNEEKKELWNKTEEKILSKTLQSKKKDNNKESDNNENNEEKKIDDKIDDSIKPSKQIQKKLKKRKKSISRYVLYISNSNNIHIYYQYTSLI